MVGQKRPKMVRYSKLVICNDYDTLAAGDLRVSPPPVTPFLCYDTCTTRDLLRKRSIIYNS